MSESDQELLELAARAAGLQVVRCRLHDPLFRDMLLPAVNGRGIGWNPLADDGDALRLAVKLGLNVLGPAVRDEEGRLTFVSEESESDIFAATRRAIVCAAAEIGKAMK